MKHARTTIIAGNWKMNYGPKRAAQFTMEILPQLNQLTHHDHNNLLCILCPPTISLETVHQLLQMSHYPHIELGAQNMYFEEQGAFTGEISPLMVHELCRNVILGHSERRMYFGETDEMVHKKTLAAFKHAIRPIVCIGENLAQYEAGQTEQVIRAQVQGALSQLPEEHLGELVIAYEPIWAIGTGKAATPDIAGNVSSFIRHLYGEMYGREAATALHILYGGSVTAANISSFIGHPDVDGALVGGASLKPDFVELVHQAAEAALL